MTILPLVRETKNRRQQSRAPLLAKHSINDDDLVGASESGFDGASFSGAVFNLSTTVVGAGIMALPAAVKVLGLVPGLVMIVLAALLTESSIDMIMRIGRPSSPSKAAHSYAGVVGEAFGSIGMALLQTCIVVNNLGMLVVYMIIIGDVLAGTSSEGAAHHGGIMEEWFGRQWWTTRSTVLLLTTLFVFVPLISFRRVDSLRYTSALSVTLAVVFVVVTAGVTVVKIIHGSIDMPRLLPESQVSFWKLSTTVPVLVTAYICHYNIHPIENELKEPARMRSIVKASLGLCTAVYVATSLFGFLLFGEQTQDDVLANFDGDLGFAAYGKAMSGAVRVSYVAHLMLVFPIVFFSLRLNLDGLLFPRAVPIAFDGRRFFGVTAALMGVVFVAANYVPSIWDAFQVTGTTATVSIGFIFPAAIALKDTHGIASKKGRILAWLMIFLAISSSSVALTSDLYDLFHQS